MRLPPNAQGHPQVVLASVWFLNNLAHFTHRHARPVRGLARATKTWEGTVMMSYLSEVFRSFHLFLKVQPSAAGQSWIVWTEWFPGFWSHKLAWQLRKCSSGKLTLKWKRGWEGLGMESPGTVEAEGFQGRKLPALLHWEKQDLGNISASCKHLASFEVL